MNEIRRSGERGHADHGWLKSFHTFSFADYFDPDHLEFGPLRVINEDLVQPGAGFGMHSHDNMEIISYVLAGELAHRDSIGNYSILSPGDVQVMSAGTGVSHDEFNPSTANPVHFLQIWIQPDIEDAEPTYEERRFDRHEKYGRLRLIASPDREQGSLLIHQDARIYAGILDGPMSVSLPLLATRYAYVHVARGMVNANGITLCPGDALKLIGASLLTFDDAREAEVLVFDLPSDGDLTRREAWL